MEERGLQGKVVVITGASSGFGKGAARKFASTGASLVLAARRGELLEELAAECAARGGRAVPVTTDVSVESDVEQLASAALSEFGRIDVWINNAGVGAIGQFERVPLADHAKVVETDLLGTLYGSWFAYRRFLEQGAGILINVASELGKHTAPYYASYTAAKHGVVGLGQALHQELAQAGLRDVHVCTVMPTAHDTPFFDHAANYTGHEVQAPSPLHDPEDVADALVRLAQDPKDEEIVGGDGVVKLALKRLVPGLEGKLGQKQMHRTQFVDVPPAPESPGAVRTPMRAGIEVSAGRRQAHA